VGEKKVKEREEGKKGKGRRKKKGPIPKIFKPRLDPFFHFESKKLEGIPTPPAQ
jgi:hypothetical protein